MLETIKNNSKLTFIHANGFPPSSYSPLLLNFKNRYHLNNYLLRPLWKEKTSHLLLKDWNLLFDDFLKYIIDIDSTIGMGHSIGGNIILRTALSHPKKFSKLVLLDPTLFIPKIIYGWKFILKLGLQAKIHPWINATLNRKMIYDNYEQIFKSYRNKDVFSRINDKNLKIYIDSIIKMDNDNLHITYSKDWEYQIYKTGLVADMFIWKNIHKLEMPCLIIRAEESNAFLNSSQKKIEKLNSKIDFLTLKGSTHLFPLEYPQKTYETIIEFLDN